MFKSDYLNNIFLVLKEKYATQKEFLNAINEFFISIDDFVYENKEIEKKRIIEQLVEPDKIIKFKVVWKNDCGETQINNGYRVQFNNLNGPYKGGLRFNDTVNESILKFLGFEQIFKNVLTGLPMGGGKGGSDFNPKGKTENEIRNFCKAFMQKLYPHIGEDLDIPAGDIGVGSSEIKYMYEEYINITGKHDCSLTGKPIELGGSLCRKEATGYGLCYFVEAMLKQYKNDSLLNKKVIVSGSGNVAIYAAEKAIQLGAKVVAMSDSSNAIYDSNGIRLDIIKEIKENKKGRIKDYSKYIKDCVVMNSSKDIWLLNCDIALPCATQNEIDLDDAKNIVKNKVIVVAEGANMPTSLDATKYLIDNGVLFAPGKASNAGGVSVSGLEIIQNKNNEHWSFEKVDKKLKDIMNNIFKNIYSTAENIGEPYNLVKGANIFSFNKIVSLMLEKDR